MKLHRRTAFLVVGFVVVMTLSWMATTKLQGLAAQTYEVRVSVCEFLSNELVDVGTVEAVEQKGSRVVASVPASASGTVYFQLPAGAYLIRMNSGGFSGGQDIEVTRNMDLVLQVSPVYH